MITLSNKFEMRTLVLLCGVNTFVVVDLVQCSGILSLAARVLLFIELAL
jgi:hypothetical protein